MVFRIVLLFIFCLPFLGVAQSVEHRKRVYLIPGQGSDNRIFKNLKLDSSKYEMCFVNWEIPEQGETMEGFAHQLAAQIDTSKAFYIVGVSLGGMVAVEMSKFLNPEKVILVSSAKCRDELPFQYRFQKSIPVYLAFPSFLVKQLSFVAQPIFEPNRKLEKETCKAMLKAKSPVFLKRTIDMIVNWEQEECLHENIFHIHGNIDNTIPIEHVDCDIVIEGGSHMMMLTKTPAVQTGLEMILEDRITP